MFSETRGTEANGRARGAAPRPRPRARGRPSPRPASPRDPPPAPPAGPAERCLPAGAAPPARVPAMEVLRRSSVFAAEIMDAFDRSPTDKELVAQAKALGREFVHARLLRAGLAWSVPARAAPTPGGRLAEVCAVLLRLGECGPWRTGPGLRLAAPLSPHGAVPGAPWPAPSTAGPGSQGQRCGWPGGAQNSRRAGQTHPGGCCPAPPHPVLTGRRLGTLPWTPHGPAQVGLLSRIADTQALKDRKLRKE